VLHLTHINKKQQSYGAFDLLCTLQVDLLASGVNGLQCRAQLVWIIMKLLIFHKHIKFVTYQCCFWHTLTRSSRAMVLLICHAHCKLTC